MIFGWVPTEEAIGAILAHTLRVENLVLKKGTVISENDIANLKAANVDGITVARMNPGDIGEDDCALIIASKLCGDGASVSKPQSGRCNLQATSEGVLDINIAAVNSLNNSGDGVLCSTLPSLDVVGCGRTIATVKVMPYAIERHRCEALVNNISNSAINVRHFYPKRVGLIMSEVESGKDSLPAKALEVLSARVETYGGKVVHDARVKHETEALSNAIRAATGQCDLVLVLGGASTVDIGDTVPSSIIAAGGEVDLFGVPIDPGNLMVMGRAGKVPVIGLPGCARSPKINGIDLVLPRLFAEMDVSKETILSMGVGGLLHNVKEREHPREIHKANKEKTLLLQQIPAIVLAAGQSKRMGKQNKLLIDVGGMVLVRRVVENALAAEFNEIVVVTGHEADLIRKSLSGLNVRFVHNPHFEDGISTSLRSGIGAVAGDASGAMVMLGDMAQINPETMVKLRLNFVKAGHKNICAPYNNGRRGNPVLWPSELFADIMDCSGDVGARELITIYKDRLLKIDCDDMGIHKDIDTLEDVNS